MDKIKLAQRTIALLSSMIESGECHTTRSREMKNNALNGLEQLTIPVVVGQSEQLCDHDFKLTQEEQDLLLGELIQKWNKSPSIVRNRFIRSGLDAYEDHKEKVRQKTMNDFWKKLNQNKEDESNRTKDR